MHRVPNAIKLACFLCLFSPLAKAQVEVPVLIDGQSPQVVLQEKFIRRTSGFRIFRFRVRQDGSVDSIKITSRFISLNEEEFKRRADSADYAGISRFKFKPLKKDTWVQCKVYTSYFNNRVGDPWSSEKTTEYYFSTFNYGYFELIKSEIDTYFRDEKTGKELEYIIRNGWVIFAPTHLIAIT